MVVLFDIFTDPDDISEHRFFIVDDEFCRRYNVRKIDFEGIEVFLE